MKAPVASLYVSVRREALQAFERHLCNPSKLFVVIAVIENEMALIAEIPVLFESWMS